MLPTQACASHTGPQGCFVHCWNVHVEHCLWLHPICTMCTVPIHEVTTYAHWLNSLLPMVGAPLCAHHTPSHQPLAIFCTAPTPTHMLQAQLHCHIWTCPSIHVSHCLEDFSPQTSPSGTIYPMVGVPSMCPPHQFSHFPISRHLCGPTFLPTWPLHGLCTTSCTLLCTSTHLC